MPLSDLRHYDRAVVRAIEMLVHADDWNNYVARQDVDTEDMARMGIEVARQTRRWRRYEAELKKERDRARRKARVLLKRHVTVAQWKEFVKAKAFHVTGSDGRLYRVHHQIGSNVTLVVEGQDVARYCLVPKEGAWIPEPDMMLAVKLILETNARSFLRRANMTDLRPSRLGRTG